MLAKPLIRQNKAFPEAHQPKGDRKKTMKIHTLYDRPPKPKSIFKQKSLTHQSFKNECDINKIIDRYHTTGVMGTPNRPPDQTRTPLYGDFTNVPDLKGAYDQIIEAEDLFNSLPAKVRKTFDNDPVRFLDFCADPDNRSWLTSHGLADDVSPEIVTKNDPKMTPDEPSAKSNDEKGGALE